MKELNNKKGFALVEFIFVLILLSIALVIASPYVLNAYLKAQKDTFLTNSKTIYRKSVEKYASELVSNKRLSTISNDIKESDLGFDDSLKYCVYMTGDGFVREIRVTNGRYYIEGNTDFLEKGTLETVKYGDFEKFNCDYLLNENDVQVEPTVEVIKADKRYTTAFKVLIAGIAVVIVIGLIKKSKVKRTV